MMTPRAKQITNGNGAGPTDVGTWYCTYFGEDWNNVGGMSYKPTLYRPLCSNTPGDYRTHKATDVAVIDFHLQQMAEAQIDFILFEVTPGGLGGYRPAMKPFVDNARVACERIRVWNAEHQWKIKYAIAAGAHLDVYGSDPIGLCMEREAREVYETFFSNPAYGGPDNYYQLDSKPILVYWGNPTQNAQSWDSYQGDRSFGERFTVRY
ncbi:MAG: glycoside hydrolase family 71/99 protein, partial [Anaerolineae bacterium]